MPGVVDTVQGARGYQGAAALLANWLAGAAASALCDLYTNDVNPEGASELDDFDLAAYTDYVQGTVAAWGPVHRYGNDAVADADDVISFVGPADGGGPVVYGFVLHKVVSTVPTLIAAFRFDEPVALEDATMAVSVVPTLMVRASDA